MMSYWEKDRKKKFKKIEKDEETSVCIIGGGLTGLSVAYYLSKFMPTILLEKNQICDKTSSKNTGKVTSQHGLFYDYLINSQDQEFASKYLEANQNAIDEIEKNIKTEKIDCDFEREDSYVFTQKDEKISEIENEYKSVKTLNKDLCKIIDNIDAPIKIKKALKFKNQAKIHPAKYGYGLANAIEKIVKEMYPKAEMKDIKVGEGKIVNIDNNKIGVYRYDENKLYKVKPICTHLGCELSFNNIEKIWECPCHGSKFNYDGTSLETPSNKNLEIIE